MFAGVTLDRETDNAAGLFLRARFRFLKDAPRQVARVLQGLEFNFLQEQRSGVRPTCAQRFGVGRVGLLRLRANSQRCASSASAFFCHSACCARRAFLGDKAFKLAIDERLAFGEAALGFQKLRLSRAKRARRSPASTLAFPRT